MGRISIADAADPRIDDYRSISDRDLLRDRGLFVAEGRLVVRTLLTRSLYKPASILTTDTGHASFADILAIWPDLPVYVASQACLNAIAGFDFHRGCVALGERPWSGCTFDGTMNSLDAAKQVVVLEAIGNPDNVGGIFRNALAFGVGAVVIGPNCADPLYRKSIRVSMGASLRVPFVSGSRWPDDLDRLRDRGFMMAALTPSRDSIEIGDFCRRIEPSARVALLLGAEAEGLSVDVLQAADVKVRIPMAPGVDSVNVATAAAIALHRITSR